jgi:hypothetical protein
VLGCCGRPHQENPEPPAPALQGQQQQLQWLAQAQAPQDQLLLQQQQPALTQEQQAELQEERHMAAAGRVCCDCYEDVCVPVPGVIRKACHERRHLA